MPAIKIRVTDFQKTTAFYTALGMSQGARHNDHETSLSWGAPDRGSAIVMVGGGHGQLVPGGAFIVIRIADMAATLDRLEKSGFVGFGKPRLRPGFATMVIRDPDGNQIELIDEFAPPEKRP